MSAGKALQGYELITESQAYTEKKFLISSILYLISIVGGYLLEIFFFEYTYFVLPSIAVLAIILLFIAKAWAKASGIMSDTPMCWLCRYIYLFTIYGFAFLFPIVILVDLFQLTEIRSWLSMVLATLFALLLGQGAILDHKKASSTAME